MTSFLPKMPTGELTKRQEKELDLWKTWKAGGEKPDDLRPLLKSLRPLINKEAHKWSKAYDVPAPAIRYEFTRQAVDALSIFDPSRAKMNTHLRQRIKKARRFITTYQNPARIPERRVYRITEFKAARDALDEDFGRPPSGQELADRLCWSLPEVSRMEAELISAKPVSSSSVGSAITNLSTANSEAVRLLYYDLPEGPERATFEYTFGLNGKRPLRPGQIAKKLKLSPSKVSRLRKSFGKQLVDYGAE